MASRAERKMIRRKAQCESVGLAPVYENNVLVTTDGDINRAFALRHSWETQNKPAPKVKLHGGARYLFANAVHEVRKQRKGTRV